MKRCLPMLLMLGLLNWPRSGSAQEASAETFVLQVGRQVYRVQPGVPFVLTTPGGERLEVVLRRPEGQHYEGDGVAFDYPAELQLQREAADGVITLTLEGTASPFVLVQIYPPEADAATMQRELVDALQHEYTQRGAMVSGEADIRQAIGGQEQDGKRLSVQLGGQMLVLEVYALQKEEAAVVLLLQHDAEEASLARRYFGQLLQTLR